MKVIAGFILTFLLGAMFISLFHMSMGMDMHGGMADCPFMAHEEVVCPMNLMDHIGAWKSVFLSAVPSIMFLIGVAATLVLVASTAPNLLRKPLLRIIRIPILIRERTYSFSYRPLQELFSNGILHPKLF